MRSHRDKPTIFKLSVDGKAADVTLEVDKRFKSRYRVHSKLTTTKHSMRLKDAFAEGVRLADATNKKTRWTAVRKTIPWSKPDCQQSPPLDYNELKQTEEFANSHDQFVAQIESEQYRPIT